MQEKLSDCSAILCRLREKKVGKYVPANSPRVSVVIPAYNMSPVISETLNSVFAQTYLDFEVILINDGSADTVELERVLETFFDRIIYGHQDNLGASKARNVGICLSRGEIIAFLDADDFWLPNYLKTQIEFIESSQFDMAYCDAELFGDVFAAGETYMEKSPSSGEVTPMSLITGDCNVITSGTILKRRLLSDYDLFDPESIRSQDFELWFRFARNGAKIGYQREVLLRYRVSTSSLSGTNVERAERNTEILGLILKKYEFTPAEKKVCENQMALFRAETELEKGKLCLVEKDFKRASEHIANANKYYRKPKLTLLKWLLRTSPGLTLKLFKTFRPAEFFFISPTDTGD